MTDPDIVWVSPGRAALVLQVSTKTVARMADTGALRSMWTDGGHRRVALKDVQTIAAERAERVRIALEQADRAAS